MGPRAVASGGASGARHPDLKSVPPHFTFGPPFATYIQYCIFKMWHPFWFWPLLLVLAPPGFGPSLWFWPPFWFWPSLLLNPGDGPDGPWCGAPPLVEPIWGRVLCMLQTGFSQQQAFHVSSFICWQTFRKPFSTDCKTLNKSNNCETSCCPRDLPALCFLKLTPIFLSILVLKNLLK